VGRKLKVSAGLLLVIAVAFWLTNRRGFSGKFSLPLHGSRRSGASTINGYR
jgi:hypothetical protein